jgi:hypothetical protein
VTDQSFTLTMEAGGASERWVHMCQTTLRHIPEDDSNSRVWFGPHITPIYFMLHSASNRIRPCVIVYTNLYSCLNVNSAMFGPVVLTFHKLRLFIHSLFGSSFQVMTRRTLHYNVNLKQNTNRITKSKIFASCLLYV